MKVSNKGIDAKYGYDLETHDLLLLKQPPDSLVQLRHELQQPQNADITQASMKGESFEQCIGIIAEKLDIALDGEYDGADLCDLLVNCLRARGSNTLSPHLRDKRLVEAEIMETEDKVEIVRKDDVDTAL